MGLERGEKRMLGGMTRASEQTLKTTISFILCIIYIYLELYLYLHISSIVQNSNTFIIILSEEDKIHCDS